MSQDQVSAFLTAVQQDARHYPLFLLLARTGLRPGEAFALQWGDLDFRVRELRVERSWSLRRIETPKTGRTRRVDMSEQLVRTLQRLEIDRMVEDEARPITKLRLEATQGSAVGDQLVTNSPPESQIGHPETSEVPDSIGGPSRTRTLDPLIKSQLLYQLS